MASVQSWFRRQTQPATIAIIAAIIIGHLITWGSNGAITKPFIFDGTPFPEIWSLFTYAYVGMPDPIYLLFLSLWLYSIGGIVESTHGTRNYIFLWIVTSAISVLPLMLVNGAARGPLLAESAVTVMWAARYPNQTIRLFMCLPVKAKWIGWLSVAVVFFFYAGSGSKLLTGLAACCGCGLAYLYAANKIPGLAYGLGYGRYTKPKKTKAQKDREDAYYSDVFVREKEREERERLRKLFESSLDDEGKN
jgi:membrane associated rhomboid family serine protease